MTPTVRMNLPSDSEFESKLCTCQGCTEDKTGYDTVGGLRDMQAHILICPGYSELREDNDNDNDIDC